MISLSRRIAGAVRRRCAGQRQASPHWRRGATVTVLTIRSGTLTDVLDDHIAGDIDDIDVVAGASGHLVGARAPRPAMSLAGVAQERHLAPPLPVI